MTGFVYSGTTARAGITLPQYDATLYNTVPSLSKIQGDWTANKNTTPAVFFAVNNGSFTSAQVLPNCFANGAFTVASGANAYNVTLSFPAGCAVINQAPGAAYSGIARWHSCEPTRIRHFFFCSIAEQPVASSIQLMPSCKPLLKRRHSPA